MDSYEVWLLLHVYNWIEGQNMSYQNYLYICRQIISFTLYQIVSFIYYICDTVWFYL